MRHYRNNNSKRNRYRSVDRNFKRNGEGKKFDNGEVSSNLNFKRKSPGKNNHNASKLVDKYNDLAREALSYGDKILSENYFQHADHFLRVLQSFGFLLGPWGVHSPYVFICHIFTFFSMFLKLFWAHSGIIGGSFGIILGSLAVPAV